ncbi:MAG: guanylate kinase, partial [Beijerinckiaceae bacterium]|nr:guanylate kinase [Beijerinckiaceae bacterium]
RRSSEVHGIHYNFVGKDEFEKLRDRDDLLEWAEVHGNFYGTPREPVEKVLREGRDMLFDIDYQGTQQVLEKAGADAVTIFILPPSMKELKARLERRAEDAPEVIAKRLENARNEISRWPMYDYVIVNEDIQRALHEVKAIILAERLKRTRSEAGIARFVDGLLKE